MNQNRYTSPLPPHTPNLLNLPYRGTNLPKAQEALQMFTAIADIDLRVNTNVKKSKYDIQTARYEPVYTLRKKGSGSHGQSYKMASIVWRWNHPDNPKSQSITRGFPTDKLWADLVFFYAMRQDKLDYLEEEDAKRLKVITAVRGKRERDSLYLSSK